MSNAGMTLIAGVFLVIFSFMVLTLIPLVLRAAVITTVVALGAFLLVAATAFVVAIVASEWAFYALLEASKRLRKLLTKLLGNQTRP